MKYQVQIKYTNPMHDHVTLRRRVESITRLVEAASEQEALNRATNQQRALGFMIKEAAVMKGPAEENKHVDDKESKKKKVVGDDNEKTDIAIAGGVKEAAGGTESYPLLKKGEKLKPMKIGEGFDPSPAEIAKMLVKKHGAGNVTKQHILDLESDRDSFKGLDHDEVMKHVKKMDEEVELDEAQKKLKPSYWKAEWRLGTQSEVDKNNKKIFDKLAKTDPVKAAAFHDNLMRMKKKDVKEEVEQTDEAVRVVDRFYPGTPHDPQKRKDVAATVKKIRKDPDARGGMTGFNRYQDFFGGGKARLGAERTRVGEEVEQVDEASKEGKDVMRNMRAGLKSMDLRHGVDSDKRDAGYKMSPAVKAAQAKSDALSKVVKRPQAGTLAAVHKSMERTMERSMKKEAVEDHSKKKARTAAEKMVNRARGNANKVNVTPEIDPGKPNA